MSAIGRLFKKLSHILSEKKHTWKCKFLWTAFVQCISRQLSPDKTAVAAILRTGLSGLSYAAAIETCRVSPPSASIEACETKANLKDEN
mmetsp:Transcript_11949/g.35932  ORF Transcript_11949/g.35932 Transcript_11949/m.35932 type:complete len:89 (-) Transcript_11949:2934-3200(-)